MFIMVAYIHVYIHDVHIHFMYTFRTFYFQYTGNNVMPGNEWEWFIVQESFLSSITVPSEQGDSIVLNTIKNSLEVQSNMYM